MKKIVCISLAITVSIILLAGQGWAPPPEGVPPGSLVERVAALEAEVEALKATLACVSSNSDSQDFFFEGCNVHVRNGDSTTNTKNNLGNLIIGYNEERGTGSDRTGSHNLVIGDLHNYSSYGGLVAGYHNDINGDWASVTGGYGNEVADGAYCSSIVGGWFNNVDGHYSSVLGGAVNTASGYYSSVSGGAANTASGNYSSVSGGWDNRAIGEYSSVSGGKQRSVSGSYDWAAGSLWQEE